jgi:hypothetical protein
MVDRCESFSIDSVCSPSVKLFLLAPKLVESYSFSIEEFNNFIGCLYYVLFYSNLPFMTKQIGGCTVFIMFSISISIKILPSYSNSIHIQII